MSLAEKARAAAHNYVAAINAKNLDGLMAIFFLAVGLEITDKKLRVLIVALLYEMAAYFRRFIFNDPLLNRHSFQIK